ncbi:DUF58 domain-containing protein [Brevibacillus fluminis]|uniref:DUF58 domain-containing protein n=1 Tax=Brevibacillus fluminis TaxID=511487 RepID=UPI003F8B10F5
MSGLLDSAWLQRLERMQMTTRRLASGAHAGKRRSKQLGSSLEFADYRAYAPGDDLRQLDWNAYGRSGKLFVKRFLDEQELHVSIYLDCSRSMGYGQPSKLHRSKQLAAALGYLSLCHLDYVSVYAFDQSLRGAMTRLQGKAKAAQLFSFLESIEPGGAGDLNAALRSGQAVSGKPGVSIILSDFLYENGYENGVAFVQAARQEVILVQVLAEEERNPAYQGELRLLDSETGSAKEIAFSPVMIEEYAKTLSAYQAQLSAFAFGRGIAYVSVEAEQSPEQIVFGIFRQAGLIR